MTPHILTLFGTRPEIIKLAPVLWALARRADRWRSTHVSSSQHTDLLRPFARQLDIRIDHDLAVMTAAQTPTDVLQRVIGGMQSLFAAERPDLVLVQGDTTTALAGALAASYARIPIGHVEAGLRTGNRQSPFPEELNRRLIGQLADLHFAATAGNAAALVAEGVDPATIHLTGNPVVDALRHIRDRSTPQSALAALLARLAGHRVIALTTHRRENFGAVMRDHLRALRRFVDRHADVAVVFPVHPNPAVGEVARSELCGHDRIHLIAPLEYGDFIHLLSSAWLIASDSGGIQEEATALGRPALVLRNVTERPEGVKAGILQLVGTQREAITAAAARLLEDETAWQEAASGSNPYGDGHAAEKIVAALLAFPRAQPGEGA